MNYILVTIPDAFDINPYICLLKWRGSLVTVGLLADYKSPTNNMEAAKYARTVGGSLIGGINETQEVLDFCGKHKILPDVQMINIQDINNAFDKVKDEEVIFRYVIDMKSLKNYDYYQVLRRGANIILRTVYKRLKYYVDKILISYRNILYQLKPDKFAGFYFPGLLYFIYPK